MNDRIINEEDRSNSSDNCNAEDKQKVVVIGTGYVGFPLACAIARNKKYDVVGIDLDTTKLEKIKKKLSPIEDEQAEKDIKIVNIKATNDFSEIKDSYYVIICVPTPVDKQHNPDLSPVKNVTSEIAKYLHKGHIIILESTVNPGVCDDEVLPILENESNLVGGVDFDLIHCPERIDPGNKKWNIYNLPRNIGGTSKDGTKIAANFYRSFINAEINEMSSLKNAEATKIVENTFRDINIAYVNELAKSFDVMGIDIIEVIKGASSKFSFMAHYPSCGVGGHCIPVDPYYLIEKAKKSGFEHSFLKLARKINNGMHSYTVQKLVRGLNELELPVKNTKIAILGLSYKANIGDTRESPALKIIEILKRYKPNLIVCDPYVSESKEFDLVCDIDTILKDVVAVMVLTDHTEFKEIENWYNVKLIVDGKNCLNKKEIKEKGIMYKGIGSQ